MLEYRLSQAVQDFIDIQTATGLNDTTIQAYRHVLSDFIETVEDLPVDKLRSDHIVNYINSRRNTLSQYGSPYSEASIYKYYSILRKFIRWLGSKELIDWSYKDHLKPPAITEKPPEILDEKEISNLFNYLEKERNIRNTLIFKLFLSTGCRLEELANLTIEDLDIPERNIIIRKSHDEFRRIKIDDQLTQELSDYINHLRITNEDEKAFFVTRHGLRLSKNGLSNLVRRTLKAIGVKGQYGAEKLRHTFAYSYLKNGGSLLELQIILGHKNLSMTYRYLELLPEIDVFKDFTDHSILEQFLN